jgi:translation initiation factor IF-2
MKTLTELSGSVIRVAAAAVAEAIRSHPTGKSPTPEVSPQATEEATGEKPAETSGTVVETADGTSPAATPARQEQGGVAKEVLEAAVANATGLSGDRLVMLHGAVEAAGLRIDDVRLVRVFGEEEQVPGATKVGAYQYVVDRFPATMTQVTTPEGRGGRGGGRGGRGGRGGGDRGVKGGGVGGFSMDSLREDRKSQRGGRGGPGGGRGPGGRGGGGRGGPPSGAPTK